jgi:ABC-type glycerol-3-phosphate transport system substrate-binding protein
MFKKLLYSGLSLALAGAVLAGCAGKKQEEGQQAPNNAAGKNTAAKVTLTFWHGYTPDKQKVLQEYIAKYQQVNPNVEIKEQFVASGEEMLKKVQVGLASNQLPDITWGDPTWTGVLASSGKVQNVEDLMDADMKKDFFPGALDANRYQGKVYSLPIEAGSLELIYNKDMFSAAGINEGPKTWDELLTDAKKLTKGDQYGIYIPIQPDERTAWTWETFLWQNGGALEKDGKPAFGGTEGLEAMQFYTDLITKYKVAPLDKIDVDASFQSGKLAMVIGTQGAANAYAKTTNIGVVPLPAHKNQATGLGTNTIYLFKSDKAKEQAAWDFVKWLTSTENNADWAIKTGYLPVRASSVDTAAYKAFGEKNLGSLVAAQSLKNGVTRPNGSYYPKMSSAISNAIQKVIYGKEDAKTALDEAVKNSAVAMQQ